MSSLPEDIDPKDMPPGTKIWYYVRHSPGDNQTIDSQVAAIMRLVKEKGWLITREFKDESRSGVSTRNRKAFELMIHLARQKPRQADMLIVWEFSRFARNQVDSQFHRAELQLRVEATQRELAEANQMALKMARNFALMERPTRSAELLLREQDKRVVQLQTTFAANND